MTLLLCSFIFGQHSVFSAIREQALKKGLPESFIVNTFSSEKILVHNGILDRFARPYEKKSWTDYRKLFVTKSRISAGVKFYKKNQTSLMAIGKNLE